MPSRRQLLSYFVVPLALLLLERGRRAAPGIDDIIMVDGWILRHSDLERHA